MAKKTHGEKHDWTKGFNRGHIAQAKKMARRYRIVIEENPNGGFFGRTMEMPLMFGEGATYQQCAENTLDATTLTIATMLMTGDRPPTPACQKNKDCKIFVAMTADQKEMLEELARFHGFGDDVALFMLTKSLRSDHAIVPLAPPQSPRKKKTSRKRRKR